LIARNIASHESEVFVVIVDEEIRLTQMTHEMRSVEAIWLLLPSAAEKTSDLVDEKVDGSRPDNKIQSPRSPRSAPIDEGLTRQIS
jgi:hypothetical protein